MVESERARFIEKIVNKIMSITLGKHQKIRTALMKIEEYEYMERMIRGQEEGTEINFTKWTHSGWPSDKGIVDLDIYESIMIINYLLFIFLKSDEKFIGIIIKKTSGKIEDPDGVTCPFFMEEWCKKLKIKYEPK